MKTRREFLKASGCLAAGALLTPSLSRAAKVKNVGIQLYTVRKEMLADAVGTLKQLAAIGYKQLESARSDKGHFYGLQPKEIKKIAGDLGMTVRSGHVHIDNNWQRSVDMAVEAGQSYLVCSSLPSQGQTVANYQRCAELFSKAAEACKKAGLVFAYHNHDYEFDKAGGKVLYDILIEESDPKSVMMEMDLGWAVLTGNDPLTYFKKYPGRFPLWHLKDMDRAKKESTEFGKGQIDIVKMLKNMDTSGMKYFFVEQEEYPRTAMESAKYDFDYLAKLNY
ncbi:sugar phosphate isomerase/epimerase family protein [Larkinella soli]|uniref:sugar phosphate isomerase/epimerase family protein n=1 Tax=Larkinella soli TaxID=1770527 RepID=UPI000FFBCB81|nr:sugar phosphate isomerase/epimerase [Larkinella soli]